LKKIDEGKADLGSRVASVKSMRQGGRQIDEMPGQEILMKGPMEGSFVGHIFRWEAIGLPSDSFHPQISIELSTANRFDAIKGRPASLTDDEAMALWDHMLQSFKLRPTSEPIKTSDASPQKIQIGTTIQTGQVCPQNGIWESKLGGNKVFMREGENVPHVHVKLPVTGWDKLKGKSQSEYVETTWVLSEYRDKSGKPLA